MHTTLSDGSKTPEEAAEIYKKAGYDVVAITDHWIHRDSGEIGGLRILSGAEYNIGGGDASTGVYHILGIGCSKKPNLTQEAGPQKIIDEVHRCSGIAILAHPAWSLNTAQQAAALSGVDAIEIFNSVSDEGESSRPYSGDFVDTAACQGLFYPLVADDDTHMYNCDETKAWIMLEAKITDSDEALLQAIKEEKFYATQGPEIHIRRNGDEITVLCSPVSRISFFSNAVWAPERGHRGTGLTKAVCRVQPWEKFIRAEVTDEQGRKAWSKVIRL
jgi:hypothetical protein